VTSVYVKGIFYILYLNNNILNERNCRCHIILNLFETCSFTCLLQIQSIELHGVSLIYFWHSHIFSQPISILVIFWPVEILDYSCILEHHLLRQLLGEGAVSELYNLRTSYQRIQTFNFQCKLCLNQCFTTYNMNARTVVFELNFSV
jgi:hypothetical protein